MIAILVTLVIIVIVCVVAKKKHRSNKEEVVTVTEPYYYDYIVSSTLKAVRTSMPALSDQDMYKTEATTTCTLKFVEDSKNDELLTSIKWSLEGEMAKSRLSC